MKKPVQVLLLFLSLIAFGSITLAQEYYDGHTGQISSSDKALQRIAAGKILIVSELHGNRVHHQNQRDLLWQLAARGFPIGVGMEFFDYTDQNHVTDFARDLIDEATFLKLVNWGSISFDNYRQQVLMPYGLNGQTYAINFPRKLSGKVAKGGLDALSVDEKKLMPPHFELGASSYLERFSETMKGHVSDEQIQNYFAAQSLWDDTMAWQASMAIQKNPNQVLMIIVGDFHVAYQDGLIARLRARGVTEILSVSQVDTEGMSAEEKSATLLPDARYGARADFIFDAAQSKK